ncbi:hypothetical protein GOP47_0003892 [Adiantum capillus-veneris]|uniref:RRM domain-containing protein n=1 Tax=Adiantum capillus-veneris TaxID=13818 RepID=A0A9D4ZMB8_ADICA|nr:hypothetical protein GOP47_0003892 [Adiantum capillus-veneris]
MAAEGVLTISEGMAKFQERVSRSVFLDDVAPSVTLATIITALGQFGKVLNARMLDCPLSPKLGPKRALVEMATQREAERAIKEIQEHPFIMMKGILRPVIARAAEASLYPERPSKIRKTLPDNGDRKNADIGRKPTFCWVNRGDPDWDFVCKQKQLAKKHVMECQYLMQELKKEEEKLSKEQEERAASFLDKFALVDACLRDKIVKQLVEVSD